MHESLAGNVQESERQPSGAAYARIGERPGGEARPVVSPWLLGAVIVMGVLLVVGTSALIYAVVARHLSPHASPVPVTTLPAHTSSFGNGPMAMLTLPLRPGEAVQSVTSRSDGSLGVLLQSDKGARLLVWQPENARLLAELDLSSVSP